MTALNSQLKTFDFFKKPEARIFTRLHLIRSVAVAAPKAFGADRLQPDGSKKLLREKEE